MAEINELKAKRDAIYEALRAWTDEQVIRDKWYHENSLRKDELNRLIAESVEGVKPTELISMETVAAEIAAKKVVVEPIKEVIEPIIK